MPPAIQEAPETVEFDFQQRRIALGARHADAVVGREIAEAVGNQSVVVDFHRARHVRAVTDDEIRAGIDDRMCEPHHVASRFTIGIFHPEADTLGALEALGPAMERHDNDVVIGS